MSGIVVTSKTSNSITFGGGDNFAYDKVLVCLRTSSTLQPGNPIDYVDYSNPHEIIDNTSTRYIYLIATGDAVFTGLSQGTTYYFVSWYFDAGDLEYYIQNLLNETTNTLSIPGTPQTPSHSSSVNSISLSGVLPSGTNRLLYGLRRGANLPGTPTNGIDYGGFNAGISNCDELQIQNNSSVVFSSLSPNTTYYFVVWAYDQSNLVYSNSRLFSFKTKIVTPTQPTLTVTDTTIVMSGGMSTGANRMLIGQKSGNNLSPISDGVDYSVTLLGGYSRMKIYSSGYNIIFSNLSPNTTYNFSAWAYIDVDKEYSAPFGFNVITNPTPTPPPPPPPVISISTITTDSVTFTTTHPSPTTSAIIGIVLHGGSYTPPTNGSGYGSGTPPNVFNVLQVKILNIQSNPSMVFSGLNDGTAYDIVAWVHDENNTEHIYSNETIAGVTTNMIGQKISENSKTAHSITFNFNSGGYYINFNDYSTSIRPVAAQELVDYTLGNAYNQYGRALNKPTNGNTYIILDKKSDGSGGISTTQLSSYTTYKIVAYNMSQVHVPKDNSTTPPTLAHEEYLYSDIQILSIKTRIETPNNPSLSSSLTTITTSKNTYPTGGNRMLVGLRNTSTTHNPIDGVVYSSGSIVGFSELKIYSTGSSTFSGLNSGVVYNFYCWTYNYNEKVYSAGKSFSYKTKIATPTVVNTSKTHNTIIINSSTPKPTGSNRLLIGLRNNNSTYSNPNDGSVYTSSSTLNGFEDLVVYSSTVSFNMLSVFTQYNLVAWAYDTTEKKYSNGFEFSVKTNLAPIRLSQVSKTLHSITFSFNSGTYNIGFNDFSVTIRPTEGELTSTDYTSDYNQYGRILTKPTSGSNITLSTKSNGSGTASSTPLDSGTKYTIVAFDMDTEYLGGGNFNYKYTAVQKLQIRTKIAQPGIQTTTSTTSTITVTRIYNNIPTGATKILIGKRNVNTLSTPVDGVDYSNTSNNIGGCDDLKIVDKYGTNNISSIFSTLNSGTLYNFVVWAYVGGEFEYSSPSSVFSQKTKISAPTTVNTSKTYYSVTIKSTTPKPTGSNRLLVGIRDLNSTHSNPSDGTIPSSLNGFSELIIISSNNQTFSGLFGSTQYDFYMWAYDSVEKKYSSSYSFNVTTLVEPARVSNTSETTTSLSFDYIGGVYYMNKFSYNETIHPNVNGEQTTTDYSVLSNMITKNSNSGSKTLSSLLSGTIYRIHTWNMEENDHVPNGGGNSGYHMEYVYSGIQTYDLKTDIVAPSTPTTLSSTVNKISMSWASKPTGSNRILVGIRNSNTSYNQPVDGVDYTTASTLNGFSSMYIYNTSLIEFQSLLSGTEYNFVAWAYMDPNQAYAFRYSSQKVFSEKTNLIPPTTYTILTESTESTIKIHISNIINASNYYRILIRQDMNTNIVWNVGDDYSLGDWVNTTHHEQGIVVFIDGGDGSGLLSPISTYFDDVIGTTLTTKYYKLVYVEYGGNDKLIDICSGKTLKELVYPVGYAINIGKTTFEVVTANQDSTIITHDPLVIVSTDNTINVGDTWLQEIKDHINSKLKH